MVFRKPNSIYCHHQICCLPHPRLLYPDHHLPPTTNCSIMCLILPCHTMSILPSKPISSIMTITSTVAAVPPVQAAAVVILPRCLHVTHTLPPPPTTMTISHSAGAVIDHPSLVLLLPSLRLRTTLWVTRPRAAVLFPWTTNTHTHTSSNH